jgi:hypothetical protein
MPRAASGDQRRTRVLTLMTGPGAAATGAPLAITVGCGRIAIIMHIIIIVLLPPPLLLLLLATSLIEVESAVSCWVIWSFDFDGVAPPTTDVSWVGLIFCIVAIL